ncbi:MAG: hypothetical protein HY369_01630 [Candidatus Aenigmarchaeota archaeon]|nr:hypothetical protein [Candidatus Aenigmarchaeota archaeon]
MDASPRFERRTLFQDPTPGGLVNNRIVRQLFELSERTTLSEPERQHLLRLLMLVGKKLIAVWQHMQRYKAIQAELVARVSAAPQDGPIRDVHVSQDLLLEFDGFLVQLKSALDYLVHVPVAIIGRKSWSLGSFGDKGERVIQALRNNVPAEHRSAAEGIADRIASHAPWLKDVIEARDRMNHLLDGDIRFEDFSVFRDAATGAVRVPMWSDKQTAAECMEVVWGNLLRLVEDFVALFIGMRKQPRTVFFHGEVTDPARSPWIAMSQEDAERFLASRGFSPTDGRPP